MNKRIGKQKAKETLPELLDLVSSGFGPIEIIDQRKNKIIAYLVSESDFFKNSNKKSYAGFLKGELQISKDFDVPDLELIKRLNK